MEAKKNINKKNCMIDKKKIIKNWLKFTYFLNSGMEIATPARNNGYKNHEGF